MKVAAYIRVSTDREEQKDSIKNQTELIKQYVTDKDYDLYNIYTDIESGTTDKRQGLKTLIEDAKNHEFDMIICKELSRLARNGELSYQLKRIAENYNIYIVTLDGAIDSTDPAKQNMFGLYAWIYEQESQRTSERIKAAMKAKYKSGKYFGSLPPYGYEIRDKVLYLRHDDSPDTIRDIFEHYNSGWGTDRIARYLNSLSVPTPVTLSGKADSGALWHGSAVSGIIKNRVYIGDLVYNKETNHSVVNKKRKQLPEE